MPACANSCGRTLEQDGRDRDADHRSALPPAFPAESPPPRWGRDNLPRRQWAGRCGLLRKILQWASATPTLLSIRARWAGANRPNGRAVCARTKFAKLRVFLPDFRPALLRPKLPPTDNSWND